MRRHSISSSLGLTIAAAALAVVSSQETYDAVIVGAGWAGLRAVETLLSKGVKKTLVLEANDRVGGRAWSKNSDGTQNNPDLDGSVVPFDLGAEWNYDSEINVQQDVLWEEGIIPGSVWEDQDHYAIWPTWPGKATYYRLDEDGSASKINNGDNWMANIWAPFLKFRDDNLDDMFGQSYGETIEQYMEERGLTDNKSLQFLNMVEDAKHLEYGTGDYDMDITEIEFTDPTFHVETNYMGVPGLGWGNIAAKYGEQFKSFIKKNAKVTEINSAEDDDYVIVTYEKNGQSKTVKARTVLVTVSVGVLKAGTINFVPSLPNYKQRSIDATGFGVINKCMMSWNNKDALVWPNEAEEDMWFLMTTPDDDTSGKWTTFSNPSKFKGIPSLTAWIGGQDAKDIETMSDEDILKDVMTNLRAMFPDIVRPANFVITRWGQEDNNILGAYSFPSAGQDFYEDLENIKKKIGKVYFAGEATTANGWATTFGAWDTGEEVAGEMAALIATLPPLPEVTVDLTELNPTTEDPDPIEPAEPSPTPEPSQPAESRPNPEPSKPTETADADLEDNAAPPAPGPDDFVLPSPPGPAEEPSKDAEANQDLEPSEPTESTEPSSDEDPDNEYKTASIDETEATESSESIELSSDEASDSDVDPMKLSESSSSDFLHSEAWVIVSGAAIGLTLSLLM